MIRAEFGPRDFVMPERRAIALGGPAVETMVTPAMPASGLVWQPEFRVARQHQEGQNVVGHLELMQFAADYMATSVVKVVEDALGIPIVSYTARPKQPESIINKALTREPDTPWRERKPLRDYYGILLVVRQGEDQAALARSLQEFYGMPDTDSLGRPTVVSGDNGNPNSDPSFQRNKVFLDLEYDGQVRQTEVQIYDEDGWDNDQRTRVGYETRRSRPKHVFAVDSAGETSPWEA